MIRIIPEAEDSGTRLDVFITAKIEGMSRSAVIKLIDNGCVTSGGAQLKKNQKVIMGQVIEAELPSPEPTELLPQNIVLDIVFEDSDVVVVNKPKGMVVHPAPGHSAGTLVNALMFHCGDSLSGIGGQLRPGIVHRIDKDTSGLIIAAKNDFAHRSLSSQLSDRSLSRVYEAIVRGHFKERAGTIDAPIGRSRNDRKKMAVTETNSRIAVTRYEVIDEYQGYTHVRCILETGRTHQIRVHMASIGHPVAGDAVYGIKKSELGLDGQCLHAKTIKFVHPRSNEAMEFTTELPDYFAEALRKLKA